jgi:hypothetical protein
MMIKRDAEWIYTALGKAFTEETGQELESTGNIQLKAHIAESRELQIAKNQLEVDYIEFEVDDNVLHDRNCPGCATEEQVEKDGMAILFDRFVTCDKCGALIQEREEHLVAGKKYHKGCLPG